MSYEQYVECMSLSYKQPGVCKCPSYQQTNGESDFSCQPHCSDKLITNGLTEKKCPNHLSFNFTKIKKKKNRLHYLIQLVVAFTYFRIFLLTMAFPKHKNFMASFQQIITQYYYHPDRSRFTFIPKQLFKNKTKEGIINKEENLELLFEWYPQTITNQFSFNLQLFSQQKAYHIC